MFYCFVCFFTFQPWWLHNVTSHAAPHVLHLYSSFSCPFPFICFHFSFSLMSACVTHLWWPRRSRVSIQAMAQSLFVGDAKTACLQDSALQLKALLADKDHHIPSPDTKLLAFYTRWINCNVAPSQSSEANDPEWLWCCCKGVLGFAALCSRWGAEGKSKSPSTGFDVRW